MSLSERRSDKPTANECITARREVGRLEAKLVGLEAQLADAERRKNEAWVRKLKERIKWTKVGIQRANFTLGNCL